MLPQEERKDDENSNFEEVLLVEAKSTKENVPALQKKKTMFFMKEDSAALEGTMGTMFRRLSTGTKVLTQTITESLQTECISSKPEPGISRRQSLIITSFIGQLENEEVYDDDADDGNSVLTNTSEFVGGKRSCQSVGDLLFRYQLSTSELLLGSSSESESTSYLSPEVEQKAEDLIDEGHIPRDDFDSLLEST
jgi:hypothetical protein